MASSKHT